MGCGASSPVKGPDQRQDQCAGSATTNLRESQEPCEPDIETHQEKESAASPESSRLPAPTEEQAGYIETANRQEVQKISHDYMHSHQVAVTGALPSSTQPTAHADSSSSHEGSCTAEGTFPPGLLDELRSQMDAGFQRRNEQFLQEVFNKHVSPGSAGLSKESLGQALIDLGMKCVSTSDVDELFYTLDLNSDGWISWSEFLAVTSKPSKIQEWASTLPLAELLADCMPSKDETDPMRSLSKIGAADMRAISACFSEGLIKLLRYVTNLSVPRCKCAAKNYVMNNVFILRNAVFYKRLFMDII
jgi:hypothetical protein